ncbi:MAG: phytoene/squalene synthase family protein [Chitinophagaceae bacterium]|nr:MAG: phytoene/squalene synthase family protein [Chitinophagaceae bacterium]
MLMSRKLFDLTSLKCSKLITVHYSTSFSLGIKLLGKKYRPHIYSIYGFVRYADEIVDTFHDQDKGILLEEFRKDTFNAIERKFSINPIVHSFQETVNLYNIDLSLIHAFLDSMEMDLHYGKYNKEKYSEYIYGSAEVVGLMCLRVFCDGQDTTYNSLKAPARSLGSAFQKVNFLRDMQEDYKERGRVYFPGVDFDCFDEDCKNQIVEDIEKNFSEALTGIRELPIGCRGGVYLAYRYYTKLFDKLKKAKPEAIQSKRMRVHNAYKAYILMKSYARYAFNLI